MERVEADAMWSLFDPKAMPELIDTYGEEFKALYEKAEEEKRYMKQVKARELYARMMRTLAQTGNGWMTFKDSCNMKSNQIGEDGHVVHSSNLCTEIIEVTPQGETAVCNLGIRSTSRISSKTGRWIIRRFKKLYGLPLSILTVSYIWTPLSNARSRSFQQRVASGRTGSDGAQDVFFLMNLPFDSDEAREISTRIQEEILYAALDTSCAMRRSLARIITSQRLRQLRVFCPSILGVLLQVSGESCWEALRQRIMKHGLRNSLLVAIAPTATIATITGVYEQIEPQVSNLFKRETLSGDFLQVNRYLIERLKALGLWSQDMRDKIKIADGSVQTIEEIPEDVRKVFRTVWELPQRALIDMAADRSPYIDQSQSLNLFMATPTIGRLSSMYLYGWKRGSKTTYYLRSRLRLRSQKRP